METWGTTVPGTNPSPSLPVTTVPHPITQALSQFKRSYQACLGCRRRKVKCDLGNPDAPSQPPCARCKREQRECVFGGPRASTKKVKPPPQADKLPDQRNAIPSVSLKYPLSSADSHLPLQVAPAYKKHSSGLGVPLFNAPRMSPIFNSIDHRSRLGYRRIKEGTAEDLADPLLTTHVHGTNDAMNLLFRAAEKLKHTNDPSPSSHGLAENENDRGSDPTKTPRLFPDHGESERAIMDASGQVKRRRVIRTNRQDSTGMISTWKWLHKLPPDKPINWIYERYPGEDLSVALEVWKKFKLVHQGWLTPLECFTFVNFFHQTLICHSPILNNYFALPSTQSELITNEPMLTMTILTIAARYCPLPGHGGVSRSHYLHERFCRYTQGLIARVFWAQTRIGPSEGEVVKKEREKGIRGLGTVESLLLWADWHPRGIHFPPVMGDDGVAGEGWDVSLVVEDSDKDRGHKAKTSASKKWREEVMEPTWRSDRLSWMLLGTAFTLAHELGIFDADTEAAPGSTEMSATASQHTTDSISTPAHSPQAQTTESSETFRRIARLRKLCYIYLHTLSTRLNWASILDNNRRLFQMTEAVPSISADYRGNPPMSMYEDKWHKVMSNWIELTRLTKGATDVLFSSKKATQTLIRENRHLRHLEVLNFTLRGREEKLLQLNEWIVQNEGKDDTHGENFIQNEMESQGFIVPKPFWIIIRIEFLYLKVFINSIALEAAAERHWRRVLKKRAQETGMSCNAGNNGDLHHSSGKGGEDAEWEYIMMAFESGMEILKIIVEGADCNDPSHYGQHRGEKEAAERSSGSKRKSNTQDKHGESIGGEIHEDCGREHWLRYAPVRVFVRLIYAAMFLMKATTVMGPHATQSMMCYSLLRKVILALRRSAVDDVHMANKFSELLEAHLATLIARGRRIMRVKEARIKKDTSSEAKHSSSQAVCQVGKIDSKNITQAGGTTSEEVAAILPETPKHFEGQPIADISSNRPATETAQVTAASLKGNSAESSSPAVMTQVSLSLMEAAPHPYPPQYSPIVSSTSPHIPSPKIINAPIHEAHFHANIIPPTISPNPASSVAYPPNHDLYSSPPLYHSRNDPLTPYDSPPDLSFNHKPHQQALDMDMDIVWDYGFPRVSFDEELGFENEKFPVVAEAQAGLQEWEGGSQEQVVPTVSPVEVVDPGFWDFLWNFNMVG